MRLAGLACGAGVLLLGAALGTFGGPNASGDPSDLPAGLWLLFGIVALCAGGAVAAVVDAALRDGGAWRAEARRR